MRKVVLLTVSMLLYSISMVAENIKFADPEVKRICIENWDTNGDGELSMEEAAAVTSIDGAFMGKEMITSFDELQFFTGLSDVGDYYKCHNLESLVIPDNVKSIGSYAFYECWHMYSLEIGNGVKYIHEGAFHATGLSSITFPNSLEYVGWDALTVTPWFTRHPDGKVYAGSKVLYCYKGTMPTNSRMDIEEGILGVTTNAFYGCSGMVSLSIPNSVTNIGYGITQGCNDLTIIFVKDYNEYYDSRNDCNAIIETASNTLIAGCKTTIIPYNITRLGSSAFGGISSLTSITIPNSVSDIEYGVFQNCSGLASVYSEIKEPFKIESSVFHGIAANAILYVPAGTKAKYEATAGWKNNFAKILEMDDTAIRDFTTGSGTFDVYNLQGHKVRSNATSLEGLPKGIFVVNGKKVIK